ncbi:DUF262 domain-containing protein [Pseudanabaena sp. FACHB-2040]|nr:DUF262 domain-containing protein [Pseudanabaena sp. FACHB-2040]
MVRKEIRRKCIGLSRQDSTANKYFKQLEDGRYTNIITFEQLDEGNEGLLENLFGEDFSEDDFDTYEEEKAPFDPESVRVTHKPMNIETIIKRIKYGEINLAPGFQRRAGIWNDIAQSRLIESVILRIPLPAFYIDASNDDRWSVVDGLQRLTALKRFVLDEELKLQGLEYFENLDRKTFSKLPRSYRRRIEETNLNCYLIEKQSPPEVKFNIFKRVNTGGLPLSPQELRHALNYGQATDFLQSLCNEPLFKKLVQIPSSKIKRMDDREFALGFLAFKLTDYREYPKRIGRDAFLNNTMEKLNALQPSSSLFNELTLDLRKSLSASERIFNDKAFRKISKVRPKKYPVNKALFETWSVSLSTLSDEELDFLCKNKHLVVDDFAELIDTDSEFSKAVSQAANKVSVRFERIEQLITHILGSY